ncbi:MAG: hypothetical protein HYZ75_00370 [Elusimicrobia bacterium]|nr:hypothetical protein [Elusimicrobiota bacterium]
MRRDFFLAFVLLVGLSWPAGAVPPGATMQVVAVPRGVDPAVWADVRSRYPWLADADRILLAKVLSKVKRDTPEKEASVQAWLRADPRARAAQVAAAARTDLGASAGRLTAWASAVPSASGAAPADPAQAAGTNRPGEVPATGPGGVVGTDSGPVGEVSRAVTRREQLDDVAKRIVEFAWKEPAEGKSFIKPETRGRADQRPAFERVAAEVVGRDDRRAAALHLYYVLGPSRPAPAWVLGDERLKSLLVTDRALFAGFESRLAGCLDRWRHDAAGGAARTCEGQADRGQTRTPYQGDPAWVGDFVLDAGAEAARLLSALGRNPIELAGPDGTPGAGPAPGGGPRPPLSRRASAEFTTDQLFGKWGDRNVFSLDGRILALTVRTRQTVSGEPPRAVISHQLGLYDISNDNDIYGKRMDIDKLGDQSFSLIPGGKTYNISLTAQGGDVAFSITRPDGTKPEMSSGRPMPTVNELFQDRAQRALASGNRVMIGGKAYRVTGESATTGNLIFWDEAQLEASRRAINGGFAGQAARYWVPSMMAPVNEMRDGRAQNLSESVPLNFQAGNGKWQGLRWDGVTWVPAEGEEFKPRPAQRPADGAPTAGGPTGPGVAPDGGPTTPPAGGGRTDADGWPLLDRLSAAAPRAARLNSQLSARAKERVRFYALPDDVVSDGPGQRVLVLLDKAAPDRGKLFAPPYVGIAYPTRTPPSQGSETEAVVNGKIFLARTDRGAGFVDLEAVVAERGAISKGLLGYYVKDGGAKTVDKVTDIAILPTILGAAGYGAEADRAAANMRSILEAEAPVRNWSLGGTEFRGADSFLRAGVVGANGERFWCVYPEKKLCNQGGTEAPGTVPAAGAGFPLDPAATTIAPDETFQASVEVNGKPAARVAPQPADAALYLSVDGEKRSWYLMTMLTNNAGQKRKIQPTLVFSNRTEPNGARRLDLPQGLTLHAVRVKGELPDQMPLRMGPLQGDVAAAGYISAHRGGACVGVVAVWGGTWQAACGKCGASWEGGRCVGN